MNIFIGASVNKNIPNKYFNLSKEVSDVLSNLNYTLICGGNEGILKELINIFKNIKVYILKEYLNEMKNTNIEYEICNTTFERLNKIYEESDLFLILPGGLGTLSELFGLIEELRNSNKKLILYNYDNYYKDLINYLNKLTKENFINKNDLNKITIINNIEQLKKEVIK